MIEEKEALSKIVLTILNEWENKGRKEERTKNNLIQTFLLLSNRFTCDLLQNIVL